MARRSYLTVPEELLDLADQIGDGLELRGYQVEVEHRALGYPYTPTFTCKRDGGRTTLLVEVDSSIPTARLDEWVRYGRSSSRDTRVAVGLDADAPRSGRDDRALRELGVGLYIPLETGELMEVAPPRDLAVNLQLPAPTALPPKLRQLLGSAYEQFERSNWREGFGDACQVVENEARRYLIEGVNSGRIVLVPNKKGYAPTATEIEDMTLGQLGAAFGRIQAPNRLDATTAEALRRLNPDRIGEVHKKAEDATERQLRDNVGHDIWIVVDVLKSIHGLS